jgi:arginase family enzyme
MDEKLKEYWMNVGTQPEFSVYDPIGAMLRPRIHDDVPSFMEVAIAFKAEELGIADVVFLGIPWEGPIHLAPLMWVSCGPRPADPDAFEGRSGAYDAPDYIRKRSTPYSIAISGGFYPEVGPDFRLVEHLMLMDYRNVEFDKWDVEDMAEKAIEKVGDIVKAGAVPLVFGGDHSTPYPVLRGISDNSKGKIGIILFDSHYDNSYGGEFPPPLSELGRLNAGNAFYKIFDTCQAEPENMAVIGIKGGAYNTPLMHELSQELGMTVFTCEDVEEMGITNVVKKGIEVATKGTDKVYVSLDVDCIDPVSFPAQKYPDPFGIPARDVRKALAMISRGTNLAGFDMVCMGPAYDVRDIGGMTAARFYLEVLKGLAMRKSKKD